MSHQPLENTSDPALPSAPRFYTCAAIRCGALAALIIIIWLARRLSVRLLSFVEG